MLNLFLLTEVRRCCCVCITFVQIAEWRRRTTNNTAETQVRRKKKTHTNQFNSSVAGHFPTDMAEGTEEKKKFETEARGFQLHLPPSFCASPRPHTALVHIMLFNTRISIHIVLAWSRARRSEAKRYLFNLKTAECTEKCVRVRGNERTERRKTIDDSYAFVIFIFHADTCSVVCFRQLLRVPCVLRIGLRLPRANISATEWWMCSSFTSFLTFFGQVCLAPWADTLLLGSLAISVALLHGVVVDRSPHWHLYQCENSMYALDQHGPAETTFFFILAVRLLWIANWPVRPSRSDVLVEDNEDVVY